MENFTSHSYFKTKLNHNKKIKHCSWFWRDTG